ncbi:MULTISPECIES: ABC transporter permease [unclassified Actinotignum]|uniref:ABC transporter permease n=1 Tax=unclassified Actinotignum TaxID=2632702 RepID=UPI003F459953
MTTLIASPAAPRSRTSIFFSYIRHELWRNLRMVDSLIFLIALPLVIFAVFGVASPGTDKHIPGGTIAAYVMVSLALYGAATAATSMAGAAAVEHDSGWGRHLSLTGMRRGDYLAGKIIVSLLIACLPIGATFLLGILTTAQFDTPGIWLASAGLCLVGVFPFAFFGLAVALALRSETAVSIASGVVVLLAFLGNLFMPLSGAMMELARYTPFYGAGVLAHWPQNGDVIITGAFATPGMPEALPTESFAWAIGNVAVWTLIFAVLALLALRRSTVRR